MVLSFAAVVFGYLGLKRLMGIGLIDVIHYVGSAIADSTGKATLKVSDKTRRLNERMSDKQKRKSISYKYRVLVNDILLDLGWRQLNVSVEGLTTSLILIDALISVPLFILVKNPILSIVLAPVIYATLLAILFSISRSKHRTRKAILIATEDLLCSSMSKGLDLAIKDNLSQLDPSVKDCFQQYIDDVDCNMPVLDAIDRLNDRLGSKFNDFCDKAKTMTINYQPGYEDSFLFNITHNAIESELDADIYEFASESNMDFFATVGLLAAFFGATTAMGEGAVEFYFRGIGRVLLVLYFLSIVSVYIFTQIQISKRV